MDSPSSFNKVDIISSFEDDDVFSSKILLDISNLECKYKKLFKFINRLDLLSSEYYGDYTKSGYLVLFNSDIEFIKGNYIRYPQIDNLDMSSSYDS